ncbi:phage tail tube protein [Kumtagia ephedrae]|jgi:hypothetical protein|uniref:Phage tail protein n=1 Tax=Kumtagia ephedrae TaxID=2116701 RepID=A0A2P7SPY9_9HYPH|nr:phage tail tube protein [Mesorhizobium ephedrae]PSJ64507.1 phage tail protein [Mesorhizobium ephedrae]
MAAIKVMNGEQLLVQIGDGATPTEGFAHDCLINTERGIQFTSTTNDTVVPDCESPELPGWFQRNKDGLSATITGAGKVHTTSLENWWTWYAGDATKNVRVRINVPAADGGGYWQGAFHLTEFQVSGTRKEHADVSVTLMNDGTITWTDATP